MDCLSDRPNCRIKGSHVHDGDGSVLACEVDPGEQRSRLVFVAVKNRVMCGKNECWATARSNTAAKRIARALNLHEPNRRGV